MQNDYNYYRMCENSRLLLEVREALPGTVNWQDLATVLAERLATAEFDGTEGHRHEVAELESTIAYLRDELAEAESTIHFYETQENDQ